MRNAKKGIVRLALTVVLVGLVLVLFGLFAGDLWVSLGTTTMVFGTSAMGVSMLASAGMLSIGHAFFMAVGAYTYLCLSPQLGNGISLGLPPLLALVLAVVAAGAAGLLFSPISSRLGGLELSVATLGLVFIGQYLALNLTQVTGGSRGRIVDYFSIGPVVFDDPRGMFFLVLVIVALFAWFAHHLMRGRIGLSLKAVRDGEIFAGAMGVAVRKTKTMAFMVSAMYGGVAGALLAMTTGAIVPESFDLVLSLNLLMIVLLGGRGAVVSGSLLGAAILTMLPEILTENAKYLPFISNNVLKPGISASDATQLLFGAAVVLMLIFVPGGMTQLLKSAYLRVTRKLRRGGGTAPTDTAATTSQKSVISKEER